MAPSAQLNDVKLTDRICRAIDSAEPILASTLLASSLHRNLPVPIAVASLFCNGAGFVKKYLPYVEVSEQAGVFYIQLDQFQAINACLLSKATRRELKNTSEKFNMTPKLSYSDGTITIKRRKISAKNLEVRYAPQFSFRVMVQGREYFFPVGTNGHSGLSTARKIKKDIQKGIQMVELLQKYHPNSIFLKKLLKGQAGSAQSTTLPADSESDIGRIVGAQKPVATIGEVLKLLKDNTAALGLKDTSLRGYRQGLFKIMVCGLEKYQNAKSYSPPPKGLLEEKVTILSSEVVVAFRNQFLDDIEDVAEIRAMARGLNTSHNQAKGIFSQEAMAFYSASGLHVPHPHSFMKIKPLKATKKRYRLPSYSIMEGVFKALKELREDSPDLYICALIALYVGLRQEEMAYLPTVAIRKTDRWRVYVSDQPDFTVKDYEERDIPIPEKLALHLLGTAQRRDDEGNYTGGHLLGGSKTYRDEYLRDNLNAWLRSQGLADVRLPTHELRKWCGSALAYLYGNEVAQFRLGHEDPKTTKDSYIDDRMVKGMVNLWSQYAQEHWGGESFVDKD